MPIIYYFSYINCFYKATTAVILDNPPRSSEGSQHQICADRLRFFAPPPSSADCGGSAQDDEVARFRFGNWNLNIVCNLRFVICDFKSLILDSFLIHMSIN